MRSLLAQFSLEALIEKCFNRQAVTSYCPGVCYTLNNDFFRAEAWFVDIWINTLICVYLCSHCRLPLLNSGVWTEKQGPIEGDDNQMNWAGREVEPLVWHHLNTLSAQWFSESSFRGAMLASNRKKISSSKCLFRSRSIRLKKILLSSLVEHNEALFRLSPVE